MYFDAMKCIFHMSDEIPRLAYPVTIKVITGTQVITLHLITSQMYRDMFINEGQEMGVFWTAKTLPEYCPRNDIWKLKPSMFL